MRRVLTGVAAVVGALLVVLLAYVAYVLLNMDRIEDNLPLEVTQNAVEAVETGREYTLLTWNLGFGAYSDDFSFFMDGGEHARALSKEAVEENISAMAARVRELDPDFALLQEVDVDADRSWHVDERAMLLETFPEMSSSFAVNYDSPYLFYPFHEPIGRSLSGILTLTGARVDEAVRRSCRWKTALRGLPTSTAAIPSAVCRLQTGRRCACTTYTSPPTPATAAFPPNRRGCCLPTWRRNTSAGQLRPGRGRFQQGPARRFRRGLRLGAALPHRASARGHHALRPGKRPHQPLRLRALRPRHRRDHHAGRLSGLGKHRSALL